MFRLARIAVTIIVTTSLGTSSVHAQAPDASAGSDVPADQTPTAPPATVEPKSETHCWTLSQPELDNRKAWIAKRQHAGSMNRWGTRLAAIGAGLVLGTLVGTVIGGGSLTITDRSFQFWGAIGTVVVPIPFYIAGHVIDPGPYHPLAEPPSMAPTRTVSMAWRF